MPQIQCYEFEAFFGRILRHFSDSIHLDVESRLFRAMIFLEPSMTKSSALSRARGGDAGSLTPR